MKDRLILSNIFLPRNNLDSFRAKKSQQMTVLTLTFDASSLTVGEIELFSLYQLHKW